LEARLAPIALLMTLGAPLGAHAQSARQAEMSSDMARMIGLSVAASGGPRDTLGLLIASVTRDGPADQAGITTGSRVLAVNGLQVRLAPADIGRRAAADSALVKFDRALRVTPPGRDVMLRVAGGGQTRLVNVPIAARRGSVARGASLGGDTDAAPPIDSNVPRASAPPPTIAQLPAEAPVPARAAPSVEPVSAPVSPASQSASTVTPPATATAREPRTVGTLADALGDMQLELRRLARDSHSIAMSDSLADLDTALGALRRRMRAIASESQPAALRTESVTRGGGATAAPNTATVAQPVVASVPVTATPVTAAGVSAVKIAASGTSARLGAPGLELTKVSGELAAYLGAQGDSALSVVRASEAWEPMHTGDVIVQVDGAAPDAEQLRSALESHRRISVTLLRRGRSFTVLLGETDAR
jgi:S1-C subfamily serine protease